MKVMFVEEIESHKAWRDSMGCMHCGELLFDVHRQIKPEVKDCWWVECPNCEHQTAPASTREQALKNWHDDDEV